MRAGLKLHGGPLIRRGHASVLDVRIERKMDQGKPRMVLTDNAETRHVAKLGGLRESDQTFMMGGKVIRVNHKWY